MVHTEYHRAHQHQTHGRSRYREEVSAAVPIPPRSVADEHRRNSDTDAGVHTQFPRRG